MLLCYDNYVKGKCIIILNVFRKILMYMFIIMLISISVVLKNIFYIIKFFMRYLFFK